jgi:hypothetical protein
MTDAGGEDLLLKVEEPFAAGAPAGTVLEFEGAAVESFTRDPFRLNVIAARDRVEGWPAAAARRRR